MRKTVVVALLLVPALAGADEVILRNGGRLTGVVVEDSPTRVVLEASPGRVTIARDRVLRVVSSASALETYRARAARAGDLTAEWLDLARWAGSQGLPTQSNQAYERVLRLDPSNAEAHTALGHVRVAGRWLTEDDAYRARGYVRFDGRWMPPSERDAILAERQASAVARAAEAEAEARVREAEARARAAEADARAAEANAELARTPADGVPLYPPVIGPVVGGYGGYGGYVPPPVIVVKPPRPRPHPPAHPAPTRVREDPASVAQRENARRGH